MQKLKADQEAGHDPVALVLPPVDVGEHLVAYLLEVGPTAGEGPVSFTEIKAWCDLTGRELAPWEVTALRSMSIAYLNEAFEAKEPNRPPPAIVTLQPSRAEVSAKIGGLLSRWEEQDAK